MQPNEQPEQSDQPTEKRTIQPLDKNLVDPNAATTPKPLEAEAVPSFEPLIAAPSRGIPIIVEPTTGLRSGVVIAVIAGSVALVLVVLALIYVFVIRVQDNDYTSATSLIGDMSDEVKQIASIDKQLESSTSDDQSLKLIGNERIQAKAYVANLATLEVGQALTRDSVVKKDYDDKKSTIENYGKNTVDLMDSAEIFVNVSMKCGTAVNDGVSQVTSAESFDKLMSPCASYLRDNETVPSKGLNDDVYTKFRSLILDVINQGDTIFATYSTNEEAYNAASVAMNNDTTELEGLQTQVQALSTYYPTDPVAKLDDLKMTLQTRQSVFFR